MSNNEGITVLSLFDGMSCGQIALRELGIKVKTYFASEIEPNAIKQTTHNFPDTVQLGSVIGVSGYDLPKIDLLIGGSPCQGFSYAGKRLNFNDPRSVLFFEYVRVLGEVRRKNPDVLFLLENVRMKRQHEAVISRYLGLQPITINSARVSAQNRVRLYWTNIKTREEGLFRDVYTDIPQPEDKGLLIRDILQADEEVEPRFFIPEKSLQKFQLHAERNKANGNGFAVEIHTPEQKASCVTVGGRGFRDLVVVQRGHGFNKGGVFTDKAPTLTASSWEHNNYVVDTTQLVGGVRRFTPVESARLQTVPDWYKWSVAETQIYKMLGNGWTVDVIKHIFSFIKTN